MAKLRLNKILAQAGLSSRRGADRLIADGHVAVNGVVTRELATLADPERDLVTVHGRPLPRAEAKHYLVLHKPAGYVTTVSDPRGRPVVADLVRDVDARLYPVGRLDWDVEGALLMTNDGALTRSEEHTSELQSQSNLVCRLLLEKKKNRKCTAGSRMVCKTHSYLLNW